MTPENENKNLFVIDAKSCLGAIETHLILAHFVEAYLFNFVDKCIIIALIIAFPLTLTTIHELTMLLLIHYKTTKKVWGFCGS